MTRIAEEMIERDEEQERKWSFVAEKRGFRCERCDNLIGFWERDVYFLSENNYCSYCEHLAEKE